MRSFLVLRRPSGALVTAVAVLAACGGSATTPGAAPSADGGAPVHDGGAPASSDGGNADGAGSGDGGRCSAVGATCSAPAGCCSNYCKTGVCTCNAPGYACVTAADCCDGDCANGKCSAAPSDGAVPPAASGQPVAAFGSRGCATIAYAGSAANQSSPRTAGIASSGDIFVVGQTATSGTGYSVDGWFVAVTASGSAGANVAYSETVGMVTDIAVSPAGLPTLGASTVFRTDAAGVVDPTFSLSLGDAGVDVASAPGSMAYQSTGALVFAGGPGLARVTAAGALDPTFGQGGTLPFGTSAMPISDSAFVVDASDRIYVAGEAILSGQNEWYVARYTPDGAPDTTFGSQGIVDCGPEPVEGTPNPGILVRVSPSGADAYILGVFDDPNTDYRQTWIEHVTASGVDAAYGGGTGHALIAAPSQNVMTFSFSDAAAQADGKLLVAGVDDMGTWYMTRLTAAGVVESAYGTSGFITNAPNLSIHESEVPVRVLLAANGAAVVVANQELEMEMTAGGTTYEVPESNAVVCEYTP